MLLLSKGLQSRLELLLCLRRENKFLLKLCWMRCFHWKYGIYKHASVSDDFMPLICKVAVLRSQQGVIYNKMDSSDHSWEAVFSSSDVHEYIVCANSLDVVAHSPCCCLPLAVIPHQGGWQVKADSLSMTNQPALWIIPSPSSNTYCTVCTHTERCAHYTLLKLFVCTQSS